MSLFGRLLLLISFGLLVSTSQAAPIELSPGDQPPNIILIMSDDQGWGDVGYNGHSFIETPELDAMAEDGFVLDRFYAGAPVCSPTRASVFTGRSPIRTKVTNHGRYLREHNLAQDTILWFCSDNGGLNSATSGGRGKKGDVYEGGLRVPGIIEWPDRGLVGRSAVTSSTMDIYPTLLAMVGITVAPEDQPVLDGEDISAILEGNSDKHSPIGFWHKFQDGQATWSDRILSEIMAHQQVGDPPPFNPERMTKDIFEFPQFDPDASPGWADWNHWPWKLHRREGGDSWELYNLEEDPHEDHNLAADPAQAEILAQLQDELSSWQHSVVESLNGADYSEHH